MAGGEGSVSPQKAALAAAVLIVSFLSYGVLQERIMTIPFGKGELDDNGEEVEGEMFRYSAFLVLSNRVVACIAAALILLYQGESLSSPAPFHKYMSISISNTAATFCQYEALKYVSFPTQTVGKCGKTLPVLILGTLIAGKSYKAKDYILCLIITLGCAAFFLTGDIGAKKMAMNDQSDSFYGLLLMGGYLSLDGFTSVFQEKLFRGYQMNAYTQMMYVNLASGIITLCSLWFNDQLVPALAFAVKYPELLASSCMLSIVAMTGQLSIYYSIKNIGALFFAIVMTTRQLFSILLSSLLFFHLLSIWQWISTAVVFGALYYKASDKRKPRPPPTTITRNNDTSSDVVQKV